MMVSHASRQKDLKGNPSDNHPMVLPIIKSITHEFLLHVFEKTTLF